MKNNLKLSTKCVFLTIIMIIVIVNFNKTEAFAKTNLSAEIVMERSTCRILFQDNIDVKMPMASTTKIVTAITVIKNVDLSEKVDITKESVGIEGSSIYLKEGDTLTVEALLYGLMLRSGNDAAHALAIYTAKTIENFANMMNEYARSVGAFDSNFTNPHGLNDEDHYTTANDLALITCNALTNPIFRKIVSTKKITIDGRTFVNKNKMLSNYEFADGVKTGYTKDAGRCLVTSATKNGMQLVSVVLNCQKTYERSTELLDECFQKYYPETVVCKDSVLGEIEAKGLIRSRKLQVVSDCELTIPLTKEEKNRLTVRFLANSNNRFPIEKGICIGNLAIYADKDLLFLTKLYTINTVRYLEFSKALSCVFSC